MKSLKPINEEELKKPAFMRKRAITSHARQQLILTALDRKEAGLKPNSKVATARKKYTATPPRSIAEESHTSAQTADSLQQAALSLKPKKIARAGEVTHYLDNISVAIILLDGGGVKTGDTLLIEGNDYIFTQPAEEMQIDRKPVKRAKKGSHIGLKVAFEAKVNGKVYKLN